MKTVAILVVAVSIGTLVSCENGRAYNPDTAIESAQAQQVAGQQAGTQNTGSTQPQTASSTLPTGGAGSATINPAHGQPGHRCDIAVGAPIPATVNNSTVPANSPAISPVGSLNLPPVQNNATPVTTTPPPAAQTTQAQPVATGKGLNPAHGQPGHRCDIAVGAPLDSKPAATPASTAATTTQPGSITSAPKTVTTTPPPATQKVAPGMNPAHGQPGHRCDIAVGAPLNSKPATTTPQVNQVSPIQPMQVTPLMPPAKADTTKN